MKLVKGEPPFGLWGRFVLPSRGEPRSALGTLHQFKVDPANLVRRNRVSALRADSVERRHDFFEIDLLLGRHAGIVSLSSVQISEMQLTHASTKASTRSVVGGIRKASQSGGTDW